MTTQFDTSAPDYLATFSLNCEPFADAVDNRFFYGGTALIQRLDLLIHLTQFGDSVIFVSGPAGSGKTTLLSRYVAQANSQWRLCLMEASEFGDFPARMADALHSSAAADEPELLSQWAANTDNSQLLVIVVDNSEQLDEPAFQRLCVLLSQPAAERVRIIMFGMPDAQQQHKQAIEQQQLNCSTRQLDMPRLSEEETASYLMYRLAVAGYSGESPFSTTEVAAMCKAADGRPAQINRLAHDALTERQARAGSKRLRPPGSARSGMGLIWVLAGFGVLALAGWLGWQKQDSATAPDAIAQLDEVPMEEYPLALPEPRPLTAPTIEAPAESVAPAQPAEEQVATAEATPVVPDNVTQALVDTPPEQQVDTPAAVETSEPAVPEPAPVSVIEKPVPPAPVPDEPATAATSATPTQEMQESDTDALPHRAAWLLEQPEASYSLQLLGSRQIKSINDYIRQHRLDVQQTAFYRGLYKGGEWYVLLYGSYPSRAAALAARTSLPGPVRKDKPWPRTLKSVHAAIHEAQ